MKISANVREYIEDAIRSVPDVLSAEEIEKNRVEAIIEELRPEMEKQCKQLLINAAIKAGVSKEDASVIAYFNGGYNFRYTEFPLAKRAEEKKRQRSDAKKKAIRDVLVQLELGGTKEDVEALIQKAIASLKQ